MTDTIIIDGNGMIRQARMTARDHLLAAIRDIDEVLGKGTASRHPELACRA